MKTMTWDEILKLGEERFGKDRKKWKFVCPQCGTEQSAEDFIKAGVSVDEIPKLIAFSCIGRSTGKGSPVDEKGKSHGCNWTLGGFFQMHTLEVVDGEERHPYFELAEAV